ncbi:MAG: helix-turn-helix domain-containing protein [Treponema sp.]|nr:helix-turn-helix domain-containing protein [Treponema sp.]
MRESLENLFIENLRYYRNRAKLSQEKLSALLDKNINYINMIEGGKSFPPLSMIEKIADILDIAPHYLFLPLEEEKAFDKKEFINIASKKIEDSAQDILQELLYKKTK